LSNQTKIAGMHMPRAGRPRGATWGETREEALADQEEVVKMVVASGRAWRTDGAEPSGDDAMKSPEFR
jgi:hypothetical protein